MGKLYGIPSTVYGWLGLAFGICGSLLWMTQFIWNWFGITDADKALYSVLTLIMLLLACSTSFVANRLNNKRKTLDIKPMFEIAKITLIGFVAIILVILVLNGVSMTLSTEYNTYANNNYGLFTGLRQLTSITSEDVNSLENYSLGVRQLVRSMFLIVPCLIGTWGGLSVLTADSISDAEGGILAIVAAFVVVIVVWMFKVIDVTLMFISLVFIWW